MITGLYPSACNAGTLVPGGAYFNYTGPLRSAKTLAEAMQEAGYRTAAFSANPWIMPSHGYDGLDFFELHNDPSYWPRFLFVQGLDLTLTPFRRPSPGHAHTLTNQAIRWLHRRPAGPFFLWIHYIDPHLPYVAHDRYPALTKPGFWDEVLANDEQSWRIRARSFNLDDNGRRFLAERYAGEVRYTDDEVGRLLAELKALDLYDPSVIMLTADHGEELWDHGQFEHGHAFYHEIISVPLILKLPHNKRAGAVAAPWVSNLWLGATLLASAGIKSDFPGHSLLACLDQPECGLAGTERVWLSERSHYVGDPGALVTMDGIKAYFRHDQTINCFDLNQDPGEKNPFPEADCPWPADLPLPRELLRLLQEQNRQKFLSLGGDKEEVPAVSLEERRRLKALGYIK
jgi:arylsulfatase A-like enzyme